VWCVERLAHSFAEMLESGVEDGHHRHRATGSHAPEQTATDRKRANPTEGGDHA
jgi:hypothetical protein